MRQLVGDDRFAGAAVYRQLTEVYRALRRYVNVFQPSMNLCEKRRDGTSLHRRYDRAQTPWQRFLGDSILAPPAVEHLTALLQALDPVRLRRQREALLDALWRHAAFVTPVNPAGAHLTLIPESTVEFQRGGCSAPEPTQPFDVTATGRCVTD